MITKSETLTPREYEIQQYEKEMAEKGMEHQLRLNDDEFRLRKTVLESSIERSRIENEARVEMKRIDADIASSELKIGSILKIPKMIIFLPVYMILAIGYIVAVLKGDDPTDLLEIFKK